MELLEKKSSKEGALENEFLLSEEINFEDKTYEKIVLDFSKIKGKHIKNISRQLSLAGIMVPVPEMDKNFLSLVAAKAGDVPEGVMEEMSAKDFSKITMRVQVFLTE